MDILAKYAGLSPKYIVESDWTSAQNALLERRADIMAGLVPSPDREKLFAFTSPIFVSPASIMVREGGQSISRIDDLQSKKIGMLLGGMLQNELEKINDVNLIYYDSPKQYVYDLLAGQIDAVIGGKFELERLVRLADVDHLVNISQIPGQEFKRSIAMHPGDPYLLRRIDEAAQAFVRSEEYEALVAKWYGVPKPFWTVKRLVWFFLSAICAGAVIFGAWHYHYVRNLNRQLAAALEESRSYAAGLDESRALFQQLVENIRSVFWIQEFDHNRLVYISPAFEAVFGQDARSFLDDPDSLIDLVHPDDRHLVVQGMADLRERHEPLNLEHRILAKASVRWVRVRAYFLEAQQNSPRRIVGIVDDITEIKESESQRLQQHDQLMQADKMVSLGTLVAGVAHEVNNPNNFILLNARNLETVWDDLLPVLEEHHREHPDFELAGLPFLEMRQHVPRMHFNIQDGSRRIKRIVEELKNYTRQEPMDATSRVNLNEVVEAVLVILEKTIAQYTNRFQIRLETSLPPARGDFQKLEQVVINLLINACQALSDKDRAISVETSYAPSEGAVVLRICDEGEGILPEHRDLIWDPFFSTRRGMGGTGLGLAVVASIVSRHQGRIAVDSEPGRGTCITLWINTEADTDARA